MRSTIKYLIIPCCLVSLIGCSSGPYELDEETVTYEEKEITADTIKTITETKEIKEEIPEKTETFSFKIQIGAFAVPSNFENFFQRAKSLLGEGVYYEYVRGLYKIRIGKYGNKSEALKLLEKALALGYYDAFIVTERQK
jgi:hypothetical protein